MESKTGDRMVEEVSAPAGFVKPTVAVRAATATEAAEREAAEMDRALAEAEAAAAAADAAEAADAAAAAAAEVAAAIEQQAADAAAAAAAAEVAAAIEQQAAEREAAEAEAAGELVAAEQELAAEEAATALALAPPPARAAPTPDAVLAVLAVRPPTPLRLRRLRPSMATLPVLRCSGRKISEAGVCRKRLSRDDAAQGLPDRTKTGDLTNAGLMRLRMQMLKIVG